MPPPKTFGASKVAGRPLPPLPKLRVRNPNKTEGNPCRPAAQKKNAINYHLSRMYPKLVGPHKRK
ncbi:40S ribosomal protein mrp10 [Diplodia intermedia]|uniref:40S ribosomal protein mrp10 n=1 Tax=Diplodia intermedia TaxID=856260 RepID=A0ABR3U4K2_9PEZI